MVVVTAEPDRKRRRVRRVEGDELDEICGHFRRGYVLLVRSGERGAPHAQQVEPVLFAVRLHECIAEIITPGARRGGDVCLDRGDVDRAFEVGVRADAQHVVEASEH